jgi:hypothetical protein
MEQPIELLEPLYENCSDDICTGDCNNCPICDD